MNLFRPFTDNINDFIDRESDLFSFSKFDNAIKIITETGEYAELAKQNFERAFRLVPVRPADWHVLGYRFE